jgi:hypothetical protein
MANEEKSERRLQAEQEAKELAYDMAEGAERVHLDRMEAAARAGKTGDFEAEKKKVGKAQDALEALGDLGVTPKGMRDKRGKRRKHNIEPQGPIAAFRLPESQTGYSRCATRGCRM